MAFRALCKKPLNTRNKGESHKYRSFIFRGFLSFFSYFFSPDFLLLLYKTAATLHRRSIKTTQQSSWLYCSLTSLQSDGKRERDPWFFIFRFNCFSLRWKIVIHPAVRQRGKETFGENSSWGKSQSVCLTYITAAKVINYCDLVLPIITWKSGIWNPILLYLDDSAQLHTWIASIRSQWKWQKFFKRKSEKKKKEKKRISLV